jgi:hypothetical protein
MLDPQLSAKSLSNISPYPLEVISEVENTPISEVENTPICTPKYNMHCKVSETYNNPFWGFE